MLLINTTIKLVGIISSGGCSNLVIDRDKLMIH
jgi:hypothetical protein